jgi:hypothetical protein
VTQIHMIKKGETLSELANRYNTTVDTLAQLNADQIKDINLIYTGHTLAVPDDTNTAQWAPPSKKAENALPNDKLTTLQCGSKTTLVDVLYVPSFSGGQGRSEQKFLFLTQEAVDMLHKENQQCTAAVTLPDNVSRVKALGELGIMDAFNTLSHEVFLQMADQKSGGHQAKNYRDAVALLALLKSQIGDPPEVLSFPEDDPDVGAKQVQEWLDRILKEEEEQRKTFKTYYQNRYGDDFQQIPVAAENYKIAQANLKKRYDNSLMGLMKDLYEDVDEKVGDYEKEAKKIAKETFLPEGELTYEFTDFNYYTSSKDAAVYRLLKMVLEYRHRGKIGVIEDIKALKSDTEILDLDDIESFYHLWKNANDPIIRRCLSERNTLVWQLRRQGYSADILESAFTNSGQFVSYPTIMAHIVGLNLLSVAVKEQCLSEAQLLDGKASVNAVRKIFEEKTPTLSQLKAVLGTIRIETLGYYPVYVLQLLIAREVATRINDFKDLVGENQTYASQVGDILSYAHQCQTRIDSLRELAEQQKAQPQLYYFLEGVKFADQTVTQQPTQLIWDELDYQPEALTNRLYAMNSQNKCHIVECALASEPEKLLYIRSTTPILSEQISDHKQCAVAYQFPTTGGATGSGNMAGENASCTEMPAASRKLETTYGKFFEWSGGQKLSDVDDMLCFPWVKKKINIFGVEGSADLSASAQFMRFVWAGEGSAGTEKNRNTGDTATSGKYELKMGLNAAAGQCSVELVLPTDDKLKKLRVPYISGGKDANGLALPETLQHRDIGDYNLTITGTIYGTLAASLHLATEVNIGNTASGVFGLSGTTPTRSGFQQGDTPAKIEGKAFAGLEVGGAVNCALNWKPTLADSKNLNLNHSFLNLFKVGGGVRGSAGLGAQCSFVLTFSNGRFLVVFNASLTTGLGCGGKISAELHPQNIDAFFTVLLNMMGSRSFKRFAFFDEKGQDDVTFKALNTVVTVAVAFGLSFGEVAMLPFTLVSKMESKVREEKNAAFVANFIMSPANIEKNKAWSKKNIPPETLANLLTVLIHYHTIPSEEHWIFGAENEDRDAIAAMNIAQSRAILKIFEWLGAEHVPNEVQLNRFENAVQRMGLKDSTALDKTEQWERYAENLLKIKRFFDMCLINRYSYSVKNRKAEYNNAMITNHSKFSIYIAKLVSNTPLYRRESLNYYGGYVVNFPKYIASRNKSFSMNSEYKIVNWKLVE